MCACPYMESECHGICFQLFIDQVKQKVVVAINEAGAEAAAATFSWFVPLSFGGSVTETLEVDNPFMFVIRNKRTGLVLFSAKIVTI